MKKFIAITAVAALAVAAFAGSKPPAKGCCGTCQKDAAVKSACSAEKSCSADAACKSACSDKKGAAKAGCATGECKK